MTASKSTASRPEPALHLPVVRAWYIVALISVVALINYFDRQSLSVVAPRFQAELHLSDAGYGHVVSLFLFASAISYFISGFLTDWLGTRISMALFVGWWSAAEASTAFVRTAAQLAVARFCLGLGEPGLWVAAPKAVSQTVKQKHHSLAVGIYTLGATVGAVIALPAIVSITTHLPWKSIFFIDGIAGVVWLPLWFLAFPHTPRRSETDSEDAPQSPSTFSLRATLVAVLASGKTWRLLIARGMTDSVWYFYLFWFPKYLLEARHLPLAQVARTGWVVYLFAGAGTILGGLLSALLIRRGMAPAFAYRRSMAVCAALIPLSPLAGIAPSPLISIAVASVIALAHMAWLITLSSTVIALYPDAQLGKAFGFIAAGSAVGGMFSTEVVAYVVMHYGYTPLFFLMMFLHPLALALLWTAFKPNAVTAEA